MFHIDRNFRNGIIKLTLSGLIQLEEVERIAQTIHGESSARQLYLLTDSRQAEYNFEFSDMDQLIELTNQYVRPEVTVFEAILILAPHEMALSNLFDQKRVRPGYFKKFFSTEQTALDWLMMKISDP